MVHSQGQEMLQHPPQGISIRACRPGSLSFNPLPRLRFSGQLGYTAGNLNDWEHEPSWGLGASLSIPLFEGGSTISSIAQSQASANMAKSAYRQANLQAQQDLALAQAQDQAQHAQLSAQLEQEQAAKLAYEEAQQRYLGGIDPYVNMLSALGAYYQVQHSIIQGRRDALVKRIQLHNAVGGAWTQDLASDHEEQRP